MCGYLCGLFFIVVRAVLCVSLFDARTIYDDSDDLESTVIIGMGERDDVLFSPFINFFSILHLNKLITNKIIYHRYVNITGSSNIGAISNLILGCMAEWAHLPGKKNGERVAVLL